MSLAPKKGLVRGRRSCLFVYSFLTDGYHSPDCQRSRPKPSLRVESPLKADSTRSPERRGCSRRNCSVNSSATILAERECLAFEADGRRQFLVLAAAAQQRMVTIAIPSVTVLPLTSALIAAPLVRIDVNPTRKMRCASRRRSWSIRRSPFRARGSARLSAVLVPMNCGP